MEDFGDVKSLTRANSPVETVLDGGTGDYVYSGNPDSALGQSH
jgi:hypothetical protein